MFHRHSRMTAYTATLLALLAAPVHLEAAAENAEASATGTAIIRVESRLTQPGVKFSFIGALQGTIEPGETIETTDLNAGRHSVSQPAPSPWLALVEITCDDGQSAIPSNGSVAMRTANFHVEDGETVACTFVYDGFEQFILPDELPEGAGSIALPREGIWGVSNNPGSMQCDGVFSRDVKGTSFNRGTLTVLDDGQRLFGESHEHEREDVMMFRVPTLPGRYAGWVSDTYEGYEVTVHSVWQVVTQEWIVGYMFADMQVEQLQCRLFRPYDIKWEEGLPG